jgi:hypothetical protein
MFLKYCCSQQRPLLHAELLSLVQLRLLIISLVLPLSLPCCYCCPYPRGCRAGLPTGPPPSSSLFAIPFTSVPLCAFMLPPAATIPFAVAAVGVQVVVLARVSCRAPSQQQQQPGYARSYRQAATLQEISSPPHPTASTPAQLQQLPLLPQQPADWTPPLLLLALLLLLLLLARPAVTLPQRGKPPPQQQQQRLRR